MSEIQEFLLSKASYKNHRKISYNGMEIDIFAIFCIKNENFFIKSIKSLGMKKIKNPKLINNCSCYIGYDRDNFKNSIILVGVCKKDKLSVLNLEQTFIAHLKNYQEKDNQSNKPCILINNKQKIVALLGVDGSGKSTQISQLQSIAYLKLTGITCIYGGNNHYWMPWIQKRQNKNSKNANIYESRFAAVLKIIDKRFRIFHALKERSHGKLVVFDRYIYDDMVFFEEIKLGRNITISSYIIRKVLYGWVGKKPDYTFYFDIEPQIAYNRKKEHPIEKMELMVTCYRNLLKKREEVVFIDALLSKDDITRILLEKITN